MTEKEKGLSSFERLMKREFSKAEARLNIRVDKAMNAVADDGTTYHSEREIHDAYGYAEITAAERRRLLQALEYRQDRPKLKEDYYLLLCRKALGLVADMRYQDFQKIKAQERRNQIEMIRQKGNSPRLCICCGEVIGEVLGGNQIGTEWYNNRAECTHGYVCINCLSHCTGLNNCKRNED